MAGSAKYDHLSIEPKWQQHWLAAKTFHAAGPGEPGFDPSKPKFYVLDMFPYPSGAGLHVGHPLGYIATDITARYRRMRGFNVLHPMGYDAFGLPAEQYAVQTGTHPAITTKKNIENIRRQLRMLGFSYDWDRELATIDQKYYKWTQWIFLQLYKRGLAYLAEVAVNWCPELGTVLANEEVIDGKSERGGHPVVRMPLKQWMLKITVYADRLLADLDLVDWAEPIKEMQRNWIGRSVGAEVDFPLASGTAFQAVTNSEFRRVADLAEKERPALVAKGFIPCEPFPNGSVLPQADLSHRNLPHVAVPGVTYFLTFRTRGSLLSEEEERDIVLRALLFWRGERCDVLAAVVMDDHVHAILRPLGEHTLSEITQSIKGYTARKINLLRHSEGHLWLDETFDHVVRDGRSLNQFLYYICDNPKRRKDTKKPPLVDRVDNYKRLFVDVTIISTADGKPFGHSLKGCATEDFFNHRKQSGLPATPEPDVIRIFTTRPDTLFGATYMVLAPEHPLVEKITTAEQKPAVDAYRAAAARKSDLQRTALEKDKTGEFTGGYAINPVNRQPIPIYIADYVLLSYGTGAIMAVPAHDERDFEFATKFKLPIPIVVKPTDRELNANECFTDDGVAVNSTSQLLEFTITGLPTDAAKEKITTALSASGLGRKSVNYKLRDWLFSRQRYWGEPFPIVHCPTHGPQPVPESDLPVVLPPVDEYKPTGRPEPLLARATEWANSATCPTCGRPATRELNTMPQWAGSCWYYLRYLDPHNDQQACDPAKEKYWMGQNGVDLYVGGAEHAVLHLLYARFWHKVLYDAGFVSTKEPFGKLVNQGMILGEDGQKMSKSRGNVINPDQIIHDFGADSLRLYEMFMGPLEQLKPWSTHGVEGVHRFLQRVWRLIIDDRTGELKVADATGDAAIERALHRTIKKVGEDIETFKFNTAISAMMEFVNEATAGGNSPPPPGEGKGEGISSSNGISRSQAERLVLILAPFAPHVAEELWQKLGHANSLAYEPFPTFDPALLVESTVEIPVQVNGKLRGKIVVPAAADQATIESAAKAEPNVQAQLAGKTVRKIIVLKNKLVNIVAN